MLHSPSTAHSPVAVSRLAARLDPFRINLEELLLRAAVMNAQSRLVQVKRPATRCRPGSEKVEGRDRILGPSYRMAG